MKYAVISDIHGNSEALQAVLADIDKRKVDSTICLGDIVGYYPDPTVCIDLVKKYTQHCLAGNHDYAAIGRVDTRTFTYYAYAAMEWTKKHLSEEEKNYLASLPLSLVLEDLFFTHSSPSDIEQWPYVFPDNEFAVFEAFNSIVHWLNFVGHTHWPSIMYQEDDKIILHPLGSVDLNKENYYLVNVGSIGQPRDFDPRSCYSIYDTDAQKIHLIRVEYDFTLTQKKIVDNGLPIFLAERLEKGR
jgi:diadenosine tetraphosphatase ApaH/serine/threonine PP2A family protein phosphatase